MGPIASQITSLTIVYTAVYSGADQTKHQSSASPAFCAENSPGTGEFPAQITSNAENISIWWRHHVVKKHLRKVARQDFFSSLREFLQAGAVTIWERRTGLSYTDYDHLCIPHTCRPANAYLLVFLGLEGDDNLAHLYCTFAKAFV